MKKRRLAPLLVAAPLALLAACGGGTPALTLNANWYANTENRTNITGTYEKLTYGVTFESRNGEYALSYEDGQFTTTLEDVILDENGEKRQVYHLHTDLALTGKYTYQTAEKAFEDYAISDVWFLSLEYGLCPIRSEKKVHSTVPANVVTEQSLADEYEFEYTVEYEVSDGKATKANATWVDLNSENAEPVKREISLSGNGSFFDNEEVFFALRGLTPTANSSFRTLDPQTDTEVGMTLSDVKESSEPVSVTVNGVKTEQSIAAYDVTLRYSMNQPGPARTLVYAALTQPDVAGTNPFRCALLRFENPVMRSTITLGTFTYSLKTAEFNNK